MKALKRTAKGRSQKAQRAPDAQELAPHSSLHPLLPPNPAGPGVQRARVMLIPHRPSSRRVLHLNFHGQFQWALSHPLLSAPSACTSISPGVWLFHCTTNAFLHLVHCGDSWAALICAPKHRRGVVFVVPQGIFGALGYFQHQAPSRSPQRCVSVPQNLENLGLSSHCKDGDANLGGSRALSCNRQHSAAAEPAVQKYL